MNDYFYFLWGIVTMNKEGKGLWGLIKWNSFVTRKTQEKLRNWDGRELKKRGHVTQGHFKEGAFRELFTVFDVYLLEKLRLLCLAWKCPRPSSPAHLAVWPQASYSTSLSLRHRESRDKHLSLIGLWILHESISKVPSAKPGKQWVLNKYEFPLLFV